VGIISTDMDFLLAGVERLWIPSASAATATATTKPPPPEEITLSAVLEQEELSMHSFQDAAILCGVSSAYCFSNMYPHKAFTFMRHYGSLEALYERPPALFTNIPLETLQEVRSRFRILVQPEELVREEYRSVLDEFKRPSEHPKQNT
jgi:5'-3' exonuclease